MAADISVSLDGYVMAPGADLEHGLGMGGEPLHAWALDGDEVDAEVLREATAGTAVVVMGRRLFDIIDGPQGWNEEMGYGAREVGNPPVVVVTHQPPVSVRLAMDLTFVSGVREAIEAASVIADRGEGQGEIVVMGGGTVVRAAVLAGLVDVLRLHISPVVLGGGTPLFRSGDRCELEQRSARVSSTALHVIYAVTRERRSD